MIDKNFVGRVMVILKQTEKTNLKANEKHTYGFVIYSKIKHHLRRIRDFSGSIILYEISVI